MNCREKKKRQKLIICCDLGEAAEGLPLGPEWDPEIITESNKAITLKPPPKIAQVFCSRWRPLASPSGHGWLGGLLNYKI